jgi:U4/U6 small nuclear ribonucleoprotein PRP31
MATLADELLNDFEDSGDENEDQANNFHNDISDTQLAEVDTGRDGDEEDMEDAEEEVVAQDAMTLDAGDDEDETKSKVEKLRLGGVRDVRSVAGLMKKLAPVLDVSRSGSTHLQDLSYSRMEV